jgi:hypothetical protein
LELEPGSSRGALLAGEPHHRRHQSAQDAGELGLLVLLAAGKIVLDLKLHVRSHSTPETKAG